MENRGGRTMSVFLSEEEYQYIKTQPQGHIRRLIKNDMGPEDLKVAAARVEAIKVAKKTEAKEAKGDVAFRNDDTCKHCGAFLPYHNATSCKMCRKKQ